MLLSCLLLAAPAAAQQWRSGDSLPLLRRATAQRLTRDSDTLLAAWRARAHGVVRMAALVEHGGKSVERVIRADELEVEVYGEAPNRHKQIIITWRDSSFLPNRILFHRDHLGIVANDFGGILRLGEGEEVRDVLHPLSPAGLASYQFAEGDTLRISGPGGTVRVVEVQVRPVEPALAAVVGTLFIDVDRAALVRFRFTFTPAAYRDPTVEDITVLLENTLQEGARWLPWRQAIVIRRGQPLLDLPIRTVLRADWTIGDYELGVVHPAGRFLGALVDGLRRPGADSTWHEALAQRMVLLPDADAALAEAQRAAAEALGGRLLSGLPRTRLLAGGLSELLRVNRVGGVTPAIGVSRQVGASATIGARIGIGLSDGRLLGGVTLRRPVSSMVWAVGAERRLVDVGDVAAGSGVSSSLATLLDGSDLGDWTLLERAWLGVRAAGAHHSIDAELAREWSWSVATDFTPLTGRARANPSLGVGAAMVGRLSVAGRRASGEGWQLRAEAGRGLVGWQRIAAEARGSVVLGAGRLGVAVEAGAGSRQMPGYRDFVLGGRGSLPGLGFRAMGGQRMIRAEIGWSLPVRVATPPFPNARYLRLPSRITPLLAAGIAGGDDPGRPWRGSARLEPVAGVRLDLWGPLLRVEAGVSLRSGRVGVSVDAHPDWWPVL